MGPPYRIRKPHGTYIISETAAQYAAWRAGGIFGLLTCASGKQKIDPRNRDFYHTLEDAVLDGCRPCQRCRPINEEEFAALKSAIPHDLLPEETLDAFYHRKQRRR